MSDTTDERLAALEEKFDELAAAVTADAHSGSRDAVKAFDNRHAASERVFAATRAFNKRKPA